MMQRMIRTVRARIILCIIEHFVGAAVGRAFLEAVTACTFVEVSTADAVLATEILIFRNPPLSH